VYVLSNPFGYATGNVLRFLYQARDPVHCSQIQTESVLVATASLVISLVATAEDGVPELSKRRVNVGGGWR
jgi:hypothetical protein